MTAKLLKFDVYDFLLKEKSSYQEKVQIFQKQRRLQRLLLSAEVLLTLLTMFQFSYYSCINSNLLSCLGIVLVGISIGTLIKKLTLNKITFFDYPKKEYEFDFIQAVMDKKIVSAEIVYDTIFLQHKLKFTYNNKNLNSKEEFSEIKIILQKEDCIDKLWYDLSLNKLYVPYDKFDLIKHKLEIPVDTFFTENIALRNNIEKSSCS